MFQASKPFPSSSPCPNDTLQCPNQSLGPSGSFVLSSKNGHLELKKMVSEASLTLHSPQSPSRQFDSPHFGRFLWAFSGRLWKYFSDFFGVRFWNRISLACIMIFDGFHTSWTSKSEQIQWEVLQKSNFRLISYRMCLGIDFRRILESGWRHFWVPIGLQKGLRMQVL